MSANQEGKGDMLRAATVGGLLLLVTTFGCGTDTSHELAGLLPTMEASFEKCFALGEEREAGELSKTDSRLAGAKAGLDVSASLLEAARSAPQEQRDLAIELYAALKRTCELALAADPEMTAFRYGTVQGKLREDFKRNAARLRFKAQLPGGEAAAPEYHARVAAAEASAQRLLDQSTAPPHSKAPLAVWLVFSDDTWVEAVVDGGQRFSELRLAGATLLFEAKEKVILTLSDAGTVKVAVNGRSLALPGGDGVVVRDLEIDQNTVAKLAGGRR